METWVYLIGAVAGLVGFVALIRWAQRHMDGKGSAR